MHFKLTLDDFETKFTLVGLERTNLKDLKAAEKDELGCPGPRLMIHAHSSQRQTHAARKIR